MPSRFDDGPAEGVVLELARTPILLRVVHNSQTGAWDALDQVDDEPRPGERIYVYLRKGPLASLRSVRCRSGGDTLHVAAYAFHIHQPDQDCLAGTGSWREWVLKELAEKPPEK